VMENENKYSNYLISVSAKIYNMDIRIRISF